MIDRAPNFVILVNDFPTFTSRSSGKNRSRRSSRTVEINQLTRLFIIFCLITNAVAKPAVVNSKLSRLKRDQPGSGPSYSISAAVSSSGASSKTLTDNVSKTANNDQDNLLDSEEYSPSIDNLVRGASEVQKFQKQLQQQILNLGASDASLLSPDSADQLVANPENGSKKNHDQQQQQTRHHKIRHHNKNHNNINHRRKTSTSGSGNGLSTPGVVNEVPDTFSATATNLQSGERLLVANRRGSFDLSPSSPYGEFFRCF